MRGSSDGDPSVVRVTAVDVDPERASTVADAYASGYILALTDQASSVVAALQEQRESIAARVDALIEEAGNRPGPLDQAEIEAAVDAYRGVSEQIERAQLLNEPAVPIGRTTVAQVGSSPVRVTLLAGAVGLMAGAGLALLRAQLDARVRRSDDVYSLVEIPVLGEIPRGGSMPDTSKGPLVVSDPPSSTATALRELRTALQVRLEERGDGTPSSGSLSLKKSPVVVITSPSAGDGRTFIAANLAAAFALTGRSTIAIDGDLRSPELRQSLCVEQGDGHTVLPSARSGQDTTRPEVAEPTANTPVPTQTKGLRFFEGTWLSAPAISEEQGHRDPADMLAAASTPDALERLRTDADVVIIDTPPTLSFADASIWSSHADGVVVVAKRGRTSEELLRRAVQRLRMNGAPILGVVLNA